MSTATIVKRLGAPPILGDDDATADRNFIKHVVLRSNAELGSKYGLAYAEAFHYIGPNQAVAGDPQQTWDEYIKKNAVPL